MLCAYLLAEYAGSFVSSKNAYELILLWQMFFLSTLFFRNCLRSQKGTAKILVFYTLYIAITETLIPSFSQALVPFELLFLTILIIHEKGLLSCFRKKDKISTQANWANK